MKKNFLRTVNLVLLTALSAVTLSACGGAGNSTAKPESSAQSLPEAENKSSSVAAASETVKELSWYVAEPEEHPWSQISYDIAKEIEAETAGALKINVYPGASLGTQTEALDMLRTGSLAFEITGPSILASYCDQVQVYSLPYAFDNTEQAYAYFASEGSQKMYNQTVLEASGVRTLDVWYYGDRHLTLKGKEPKTPADLSGLSIRCMDTPIAKTVVAALGGNPVPINMSELYLALQTGVVVGQENPVPTIIAQKFFEVQDTLVLTKHSIHLGTVEVSEQVWQDLTEEQRQIITKILDKYRPIIEKRINEGTKEGLKMLEDKGVKVIEPDLAVFKENAKIVVDKNFGDDPKWAAAIKDLEDFKANWKK